MALRKVSGLEPNTEYTASVFVRPYNIIHLILELGMIGFYIVFHDDNNGNWSTNYNTNWNNAQKSNQILFK